MHRRFVVVVTSLVVAAGCASAQPVADANRSATSGELGARLAPPDNAVEAQMLLAGAVGALEKNEPQLAARMLDALARSDNLTERGRANVYWLMAEANQDARDDRALVDALGGFLVAVQVLENDEGMLDRQAQARAALISAKLRLTPALGSSPDFAIPVDGPATTVVERLGCGPRRDMPYVEKKTNESGSPDGRLFEEHTLTCTDDGAVLTLWFDVTPR